MASLCLGISAPCPDALGKIEEQKFRSKILELLAFAVPRFATSLLYHLWHMQHVSSDISPLLLTQHLVQKCHRNWRQSLERDQQELPTPGMCDWSSLQLPVRE